MVAFLAEFVYGATSRRHRSFLALGITTALLGLVIPSRALYGLEVFQDATVVVSAFWSVTILIKGARAGVESTWLLTAVLGVPVMLFVLYDLLLNHGLRAGSPRLYETALLLVAATGAALVFRDVQASELFSTRIAARLGGVFESTMGSGAGWEVAHLEGNSARPAAERLPGPEAYSHLVLSGS